MSIQTFPLSPNAYLYQADCRDVLAALPPDSIDAVFCDPPYNIESIAKRFGKADAAPPQHGKDGAYNPTRKIF